MTITKNRVAVLHGVNFDVLEQRDPSLYGGGSLAQLETQIGEWAHELGLEPIFFQTNHEGEFVEQLHKVPELADSALINAGAWTHYSRAIADALAVADLPSVEVHLSDVENREDWRKVSVFDGLVLRKISGKGAEGYREGLEALAAELGRGLMRGRGDRLEAALVARGLDTLLVTDLTNVRYLTGFTGSNGAVICGPGVRLFLTDFRYTERAAVEVEGWESITLAADWLGGIAERVNGRVGFEDDKMSVRTLAKLEEKLGDGAEAVPAGGEVENLRRVKDEGELRTIREASKLADEAWLWAVERGFKGRSERDVARATEAKIFELGGEPSFLAIVASGPNSALPHAEPGDRVIGEGELVVFDMGAKLDGYCSDGTRTFATGEPGEKGREVYETTLRAQLAALDAIEAGPTGEELDTIARDVIAAAGYGEAFGHSLGHGVGLEVHEGPRLSQKSDDVLAPGEVVTVEPGIYLAGEVGVRIEDFVVVTEDGYENLSSLPKDLQFVD